MNLTIDEVKQIVINQSAREDKVRTMQLLLAEDLLKAHERIEELENECEDWERLGYKK